MNARVLWSLWLGVAVIIAGSFTVHGQAPARPLGEADLNSMLGLGLDDETIVARIKKPSTSASRRCRSSSPPAPRLPSSKPCKTLSRPRASPPLPPPAR